MSSVALSDVALSESHLSKISNKLYANLASLDELTMANIVPRCLDMMKTLENYQDLTGKQREKVLLGTFTRFIENTVPESDHKILLRHAVEYTLPPMIETFVKLDRGDLEIAIKEVKKKCFPCC